MKLSIVIPCYNEAENIPLLLEAYAKTITRDDIEIILVDNGSTDETASLLQQQILQYERFLRVVTVTKNQGYGYGILEGLKQAKGEFIGWTHGDLQTPPKDILTALDILEQNTTTLNIYIKGNRKDRPLLDRFFTGGMSVFETIYFGVKMHDINAQPNIFHRSFFTSWNNPPFDFALDLYVFYMATKANLLIIRFPVQFLKRQYGASKWNTGMKARLKFIKRTILFSIELKKRLRVK